MDITSTFPLYSHIYSRIRALLFTAETRPKIVHVLIQELCNKKLISLSYENPSSSLISPVPTITYRYMDDATSYTLAEDMYLAYFPDIRKYIPISVDTFERYYREAGEAPIVDEAIVDMSILNA